MKNMWATLKSYFWWTHERGSFHYDVMVTLILLFIFVSPLFINYKDKPAERLPRPRSVVVIPDGEKGFIFRVDARDVPGKTQAEQSVQILQVIEPIVGYVKLDHWAPEQDNKGNLVGYHVWVRR